MFLHIAYTPLPLESYMHTIISQQPYPPKHNQNLPCIDHADPVASAQHEVFAVCVPDKRAPCPSSNNFLLLIPFHSTLFYLSPKGTPQEWNIHNTHSVLSIKEIESKIKNSGLTFILVGKSNECIQLAFTKKTRLRTSGTGHVFQFRLYSENNGKQRIRMSQH